MAKFCNQCGRPLADGETCICQQQAQQQVNYTAQQPQNTYQDMYQNIYQNQQNTYTGQTYQEPRNDNPNNYEAKPKYEDGIPFAKLIGLGEGDKNDVSGCFERNLKVTPELVAPCENEIPVKQYDLCYARSRMRGLWQEGRLQITNKRVLFRLSGRSWIGRVMDHTEFSIDEIAGISISNGVRFGLWDFLFMYFIFAPILFCVSAYIGLRVAFLGFLLGIAAIVPLFIFKKKFFIKGMSSALSMGSFMGASTIWAMGGNFSSAMAKLLMFFVIVMFIVGTALIFLAALKPSLSIKILTKCASDSPIYVWSHQTMASIVEILPGKDAEDAIQEVGAMITDIQKFGDFGLEKWKED